MKKKTKQIQENFIDIENMLMIERKVKKQQLQQNVIWKTRQNQQQEDVWKSRKNKNKKMLYEILGKTTTTRRHVKNSENLIEKYGILY